jgi:hypothetical protein
MPGIGWKLQMLRFPGRTPPRIFLNLTDGGGGAGLLAGDDPAG